MFNFKNKNNNMKLSEDEVKEILERIDSAIEFRRNRIKQNGKWYTESVDQFGCYNYFYALDSRDEEHIMIGLEWAKNIIENYIK